MNIAAVEELTSTGSGTRITLKEKVVDLVPLLFLILSCLCPASQPGFDIRVHPFRSREIEVDTTIGFDVLRVICQIILLFESHATSCAFDWQRMCSVKVFPGPSKLEF